MFEVLKLIGLGVNPLSARDIVQTFYPIDESAQLRRTINGTLINISLDEFRKLGTTIGCEDIQVPLFSNIYVGMPVTVHSVADLGYDTAEGGTQIRPEVPGSLRQIGTSTIWLYKPILNCLITEWEQECEMAGKVMSWSITLEEV